MSGNGRGNMRPTSRSPPFLVIGLLVAMCILAFNYWNLSSKNGDLSRQLETLQVDFRAVSDKHLTVEKRAADLASQLSESQTKQNQLQSSLAGKETKLSELNGEVETLRGQLQTATESLQNTQNEVQKLQQEKSSVQEELERVKAEALEQKNAPVVCNTNACKDPVREVIGALTKSLGKPAVAGALKQQNVDVSQVAGDLLEGADQPPAAAPAGDGQQNQPAAQQVGNQQAPAQVVGQDPNVVQMQQPAAFGVPFPQQGGGGGGNVPLTTGQQQQQPIDARNLPLVNALDSLHSLGPGLPGQQFQQPQGGAGPKQDLSGPEQEIVAQNIPHAGVDEVVVNNDITNNGNELNVAAAQEDVIDDRHLDLPEDEMDKQAAANHVAVDMGNLAGSLHDQLQDLSKNEGDGRDDQDQPDDEEKGDGIQGDGMDVNLMSKFEQDRREDGDDIDDLDQQDQRQMEEKQGGETEDQKAKEEKEQGGETEDQKAKEEKEQGGETEDQKAKEEKEQGGETEDQKAKEEEEKEQGGETEDQKAKEEEEKEQGGETEDQKAKEEEEKDEKEEAEGKPVENPPQ